MQQIRTEAWSSATPSQVFALLVDGRTWPQWGDWTDFRLDEPGADGDQGAGSVRALVSRSFGRTIVSRERITDVEPDRRVEYDLLSGLPLIGYHGIVELVPERGGTRIVWSSSFERARTPGTAWLYRSVLQAFIARTASRLAAAATSVRATA